MNIVIYSRFINRIFAIFKYFTLVVSMTEKEIQDLDLLLKSKKTTHRDLKRKLARDIVSIYHGAEAASEAEENFDKLFIKIDTPDNIFVTPHP